MMSLEFVIAFTAALIRDERGRILIGRHPEIPGKIYPKLWDMPGGKLEVSKGETLEECVIRETKEETGLEVTSVTPLDVFTSTGPRILSQYKGVLPRVCVCYYVETRRGPLKPTELEEMHFADLEELKERIAKEEMVPWCNHFIEPFLR